MKYKVRVVDITSQKKVEWRAVNRCSLHENMKTQCQDMSLSDNCFERSKFHNAHYLPTGHGKQISFTTELSLESHPSGCFLWVFVLR